jgi:DNA-binding HxlR family transcriptional regulator
MEDKLIELNQMERQLILYDIFRMFREVKYSDIRFVLKKVEKRTLQRDVRDLIDAGLISVKYSKQAAAYLPDGEETGEISEYALTHYSKKKIKHLKRLQRLVRCMMMTDDADPVGTYFATFPETTERTRRRDFATLRRIGYDAGYDRDYNSYFVSNDYVNPCDGYGVFVKDGKLVRYL